MSQRAQHISPRLLVFQMFFLLYTYIFFFLNAHSRGMPLSPAGGLCTTGLQERLVSTMAATISSISTAASAFLHRKGRDVKCVEEKAEKQPGYDVSMQRAVQPAAAAQVHPQHLPP